ncbi:hypothetical protein CROQUDRAFT_650374, partial [Cronartium quercuum f. sp. fusiforme G11]
PGERKKIEPNPAKTIKNNTNVIIKPTIEVACGTSNHPLPLTTLVDCQKSEPVCVPKNNNVPISSFSNKLSCLNNAIKPKISKCLTTNNFPCTPPVDFLVGCDKTGSALAQQPIFTCQGSSPFVLPKCQGSTSTSTSFDGTLSCASGTLGMKFFDQNGIILTGNQIPCTTNNQVPTTLPCKTYVRSTK